MAIRRLTQRQLDTLKPNKRSRDIRDAKVRGFGVRVLSSGRKHYFIHCQADGRRVWHTIGDAKDLTLAAAREKARSIMKSPPSDSTTSSDTPDDPLFETVADEVFRRYGQRWKKRTLAVNAYYFRNQVMPWFKGRTIASITRLDVQRWFASLYGTPTAADRSAPVLSVILKQAEIYGHRPEGSNPCVGIKRYRRRGRERFLTRDEMRRLSRVLDQRSQRYPLQTSLVRLLLLTGCRRSEILTLRWSEYREGRLYLSDSKTGPRTVWLSSPARQILDRLQSSEFGPWVFPAKRGDKPIPESTLGVFWQNVRRDAGIEDVRLHDLRHTFASVALAHGETVLTIGRLLGHNDPATTLKYTHLADASVHEASEALAPVLAGEA